MAKGTLYIRTSEPRLEPLTDRVRQVYVRRRRLQPVILTKNIPAAEVARRDTTLPPGEQR